MAKDPMAEIRRRVPARGEGEATLKMLGAIVVYESETCCRDGTLNDMWEAKADYPTPRHF
jgi:hypothetical protein